MRRQLSLKLEGSPFTLFKQTWPREVAKKSPHHIYTLSCSHGGQSQKLLVVGGWELGYHQDCRESSEYSIRATGSGPANSNIHACSCPSHHTTLRISNTQGPLPQRTVSPRLLRRANWKARVTGKDCPCSQGGVFGELKGQLIVKSSVKTGK